MKNTILSLLFLLFFNFNSFSQAEVSESDSSLVEQEVFVEQEQAESRWSKFFNISKLDTLTTKHLGPYDQAMGMNLGSSFGISYKQFVLKNQAVEVTASLPYVKNAYYSYYRLTALYLYERNLFLNGLFLYGGGGINMGTFEQDFEVGLTIALGVEYKINKIPVSIIADWRPTYNFTSGSKGTDGYQAAVGVKYSFD